MKELQVEVCGLKSAVDLAKSELVEKENSWAAEKASLVSRVDDLGVQLARCQAELSSLLRKDMGSVMVALLVLVLT